jgi:hypothetical protein
MRPIQKARVASLRTLSVPSYYVHSCARKAAHCTRQLRTTRINGARREKDKTRRGRTRVRTCAHTRLRAYLSQHLRCIPQFTTLPSVAIIYLHSGVSASPTNTRAPDHFSSAPRVTSRRQCYIRSSKISFCLPCVWLGREDSEVLVPRWQMNISASLRRTTSSRVYVTFMRSPGALLFSFLFFFFFCFFAPPPPFHNVRSSCK